MANEFKNAVKKDITTVITVYTAPALKTSILIELDIANVITSGVSVTAELIDDSAGVTANIIKDVPIPAGSTLQVVQGQKIVLEPGDSIKVTSTGNVDAIASILEDV